MKTLTFAFAMLLCYNVTFGQKIGRGMHIQEVFDTIAARHFVIHDSLVEGRLEPRLTKFKVSPWYRYGGKGDLEVGIARDSTVGYYRWYLLDASKDDFDIITNKIKQYFDEGVRNADEKGNWSHYWKLGDDIMMVTYRPGTGLMVSESRLLGN